MFFILAEAVIDGLHITGGNALGQLGGHMPTDPNGSSGGGVYVYCLDHDFTVTNNHFFGNTARQGGGMYTSFCGIDAIFRGNTFISNSVTEAGGGLAVHAGGMDIIDSHFEMNEAQNGGGYSTAAMGGGDFFGCTFINNHARSMGGGLALETTASLNETVILSNTADERGGGVGFYSISFTPYVTFSNVLIAHNQAGLEGTGVFIPSGGMEVHLLHTTLTHNSGGDGTGISIGELNPEEPAPSTVTITNIIIDNQDIGIRVKNDSVLTANDILWHNTPITLTQSPSATVSVENQITGDPVFLSAGDYHIGATSAARDAGVDTGVMMDIDGQIRPMGLGYDLGADEYPAPALSVANGPAVPFVNQGQMIPYILTVTNVGAGSVPASGIVLTDTLDIWQRATGAVAMAGTCAITDPGWGGEVVCAVGALNSGASATITLTVETSAAVPLGQAIVNTAVARANETRTSTAQATTYAQNCHARINASSTAYTVVQAAVDAASPGDVIKVAGTCIGVNERAGLRQQVYLDKSITLRGGYTTTNWLVSAPEANPTTLDALGAGRVVYVTGATSPTIEGLHITGGDATGLGGLPWDWDAGSGVYVISATATINHNWVYDNNASGEYVIGGGVFLQNNTSAMSDNTIFNNTARYGGGILTLASSSTLDHNTIMSNTARGGGGVALWGLFEGAKMTITANIVKGNTASDIGGGMSVGAPGSTLINNIITDNAAGVSGSGLYIDGSAQFLHTTVARNSGGDGSAIYVFSDVSGGGVLVNAAFTNTILAQSSVGISVTGGNTVTVNGILWYTTPVTLSQALTATVEIQNQSTGDPLFAADGYHLRIGSPAIDTGVPVALDRDVDGDPRPYSLGFDIGADEVPVVLVEPDTGATLVYTNTQGSETTLVVPPSAVTQTVSIVLTQLDPATTPTSPTLVAGGIALKLDAYQGDELVSRFTFGVPVTLTLMYNDADVAGMDESTLRLYRYVCPYPESLLLCFWEVIGTRPGEGQTLDMENNVLTAWLLGFTRFGTMGTGQQPAFEVSKVDSGDPIAGMPVTYILTVVNSGDADATNVVLEDAVPASLTWTGGGTLALNRVRWTFEAITASGGTGVGEFTAILPCTATLAIVNEDYRVVSSAQGVTSTAGPPVSFTVISPMMTVGIDYTPSAPVAGDTVTFTAVATTNGTPLSYAWDFGGTGQSAAHTYAADGTYTVTVTATDTCGYTWSTSTAVTVLPPGHTVYLPLVMRE